VSASIIIAEGVYNCFLQIWGGDEIVTLFEHKGKVLPDNTFAQAVTKIKESLAAQINDIYPVYKTILRNTPRHTTIFFVVSKS